MSRVKVLVFGFLVFGFLLVSSKFGLIANAGEFTGKVKSVDTAANKLVITTDAGEEVTFTADDKTKVTIIDVDGAKTKADLGSILSADKDGADKADTAVVEADDSKVAKKVTATTTRRMTLTKEEIKKRTEALIAGNKEIAESLKVKTDSPGTINCKLRIMTKNQYDVLVYIEDINGNKFAPAPKEHVAGGEALVNTKSAGSPSEFPMMDQVNITFTPHVLPVVKGSVVDFPNSDTVRHNVFSPEPIPGTEEKINLGTYDVGTIKTIGMNNPGELALLCNVHAEMSGYIVSVGNPYFALTDRRGQCTIDNVPPGKYTLKTWHDRFAPVTAEVTVEAGQTAEVKLPTMKKKK